MTHEQCSSAPPSSSGETTSPVAALTRGGPPRNIVPSFRTITLSSAMDGTYAPPAVQLPMTTAIWKKMVNVFFIFPRFGWGHRTFYRSSRRIPEQCPAQTSAPGWRISSRNGPCLEKLRLGAGGSLPQSRRGRCKEDGSARQSPAPADASWPLSGSTFQPSPSRRCPPYRNMNKFLGN